MPEPVILKYLFFVEYTDGTIYQQTPEDKSKIDPEKRSEFYDVLHSGKIIKRFSLIGDGNKVTVDLSTGLFYVNGLAVLLESDQLPTRPDLFDLIFYRQWTKDQNVTFSTKTGQILNRKPAGSFCEYFIGWRCTIAGREYKQKLAVA
jgi:hypothetical protein